MRLVPAIAATLLLTACGSEQQSAESPAAADLAPSQQAFTDANARMHAAMAEIPADADEAFMRGMLAHHRGAVEMAEVELAHGTNPQARALAEAVIAAQTEEIAQMEAWLGARGLSTAPAQPVGEHTGH